MSLSFSNTFLSSLRYAQVQNSRRVSPSATLPEHPNADSSATREGAGDVTQGVAARREAPQQVLLIGKNLDKAEMIKDLQACMFDVF